MVSFEDAKLSFPFSGMSKDQCLLWDDQKEIFSNVMTVYIPPSLVCHDQPSCSSHKMIIPMFSPGIAGNLILHLFYGKQTFWPKAGILPTLQACASFVSLSQWNCSQFPLLICLLICALPLDSGVNILSSHDSLLSMLKWKGSIKSTTQERREEILIIH